MASKIGKAGWITLYVAAGITDLIQLLIGIFEVPLSAIAIGLVLVAINEAADPFIGGAIIIWLQVRGVSVITKVNRLVSLIGVAGLEEFTGGIAPFWIADIWYIHRDVKKEQAALEAQEQQNEMLQTQQQALYADGMGRPRGDTRQNNSPLNAGGVSRPRGRIAPLPQITGPANEEDSLAA